MNSKTVLIDDSENTEMKPKKIDFNSIDTGNFKKPEKLPDIDNIFKDYANASTSENISNSENIISDENEPIISRKRGRRKKSIEPVIIGGEVLTGALLITLIDLLLPMGITTVNNMLSKDKMSFNDLRLKQTQKNELAPIADAVMKELQIKANPIYILIISLVSIYGLNFVEAKFNKPTF